MEQNPQMEQTPQTEPSSQPKQQVNLHTGVVELALKIWRTIILCTVICAVVVFSLSSLMVKGVWGPLVVQAVCLIIAGVVVYSQMWGFGDRDANFIQFGRLEKDPLKGLKVMMLAVIPSLVLCIPLALSMAEVLPFDFMPFYRILEAPVWPLINVIHPYGAIAHAAVEANEYMEATAATAGLGWGQFVLVSLLPLIYVPFGVAGYELGLRRISVGLKLMYEDKNKKKGKEKK